MKNNIQKIESIVEPMLGELNKIEVKSESMVYPQRTFTYVSEISFGDDGTYGLFFHTNELRKVDSDYNDNTMEYDLLKHFKRIFSKASTGFEFARDEDCEKGNWGFYVRPTAENRDFEKMKDAKSKLDKATDDLRQLKEGVYKKIKSQSSKKKTCKHCDSNVSVAFLKSYQCPVCSKPLFTDTESKRHEAIKLRFEKVYKEYKAMK